MTEKAIVLIRGLFREKRHWGTFPQYLQSEFPNRKIITLNLAGTGDRNHLESPITISEMVNDLRLQLRLLYPDVKQIELVGLSMGGMITLEWCQRFPDEVDKAVLINTSTKSLSGFYERLRWQQYGNILKSVVSNTEKRERFSYELCSNNPVDETIVNDWISWAHSEPMSYKSTFNQLIACMNYTLIKKPSVPMLVLVSTHDQMVSPKCSLRLAEHWKLPIKAHPSAGHDLPIDDASWVKTQIKRFLCGTEVLNNLPSMGHCHTLTKHQAD